MYISSSSNSTLKDFFDPGEEEDGDPSLIFLLTLILKRGRKNLPMRQLLSLIIKREYRLPIPNFTDSILVVQDLFIH
jgi:hypothetical protein